MPSKTKKELLAGVYGVVKSKFIGCNTLELEYENGNKAIRYHYTDVITMYPNGDTELTSGGWRTYTTKERLNRKFNVWSDKGIWYIKEPATGNTLTYFDGIKFDSAGYAKETKEIDIKHINRIKRKIAKYVKLVDDLESIPFPNSGDCWDCCMKTKEGLTLGDATGNHTHLESHLEDGYLHGSIIYNALQEKGYNNPAFIMQCGIKDAIKRALRRYFMRRLLPEVQAA